MSAPLRIAVLGASGSTGRLIVDEALQRGHEVHAIVRNPDTFEHEPNARLTIHRGDVHDAPSLAAAITPDTVVLSGLGVRTKTEAGTLSAGARSVLAARPSAVIWLGAIGTGRSSSAVGRLTHRMLKAGFGAEYVDKEQADNLILDAAHTVIHSGPLSDKSMNSYWAMPLASVRRRFFPAFIPRTGVAKVMLDEAESRSHPGQIVVPVRKKP